MASDPGLSRTAADLLTVLSCFAAGRDCPSSLNSSWEDVYGLAEIHGVHNIVGYCLSRSPGQLDGRLRERFRRACVRVYAHMALKQEQKNCVCSLLSRNGIDHVLLKGAVVRNYYPVPELRTFGDIDLIIRPQDRRKSHELMLAEGFEVVTDWEPTYAYKKSISEVELHTELLDTDLSGRANSRAFFRNTMWNHVIQTGPHEYRFTPDYHFLFLLTHIAKHISGSGAGIRMFLDLALMLRWETSLNWEWLEEKLKELGLWRLASHTFLLLERCFDCKVPLEAEKISREEYERFVYYVMEAGIFGFENRDSGAVALSSSHRAERPGSRKKEILRRIFPSASSISARYTYLEKTPWLLPVAWVHRWMITAGDTAKHLKQAKNIMKVDQKEVENLKQIRRQLRL